MLSEIRGIKKYRSQIILMIICSVDYAMSRDR